jgi:hypothetical protein
VLKEAERRARLDEIDALLERITTGLAETGLER